MTVCIEDSEVHEWNLKLFTGQNNSDQKKKTVTSRFTKRFFQNKNIYKKTLVVTN